MLIINYELVVSLSVAHKGIVTIVGNVRTILVWGLKCESLARTSWESPSDPDVTLDLDLRTFLLSCCIVLMENHGSRFWRNGMERVVEKDWLRWIFVFFSGCFSIPRSNGYVNGRDGKWWNWRLIHPLLSDMKRLLIQWIEDSNLDYKILNLELLRSINGVFKWTWFLRKM